MSGAKFEYLSWDVSNTSSSVVNRDVLNTTFCFTTGKYGAFSVIWFNQTKILDKFHSHAKSQICVSAL